MTPSEVQLSAQIDPDGSDTHYYFQYGTVDCASEPGGMHAMCPAAPGNDLGSGFGAQQVERDAVRVCSRGRVYFYRVLASNGLGQAEGEQSVETFQTLPSSQGLLADGRAWELVSPAEKDGASIEPLSREGGLIQASAGRGSDRVCRERAGGSRTGWEPGAGTDAGALGAHERRLGCRRSGDAA